MLDLWLDQESQIEKTAAQQFEELAEKIAVEGGEPGPGLEPVKPDGHKWESSNYSEEVRTPEAADQLLKRELTGRVVDEVPKTDVQQTLPRAVNTVNGRAEDRIPTVEKLKKAAADKHKERLMDIGVGGGMVTGGALAGMGAQRLLRDARTGSQLRKAISRGDKGFSLKIVKGRRWPAAALGAVAGLGTYGAYRSKMKNVLEGKSKTSSLKEAMREKTSSLKESMIKAASAGRVRTLEGWGSLTKSAAKPITALPIDKAEEIRQARLMGGIGGGALGTLGGGLLGSAVGSIGGRRGGAIGGLTGALAGMGLGAYLGGRHSRMEAEATPEEVFQARANLREAEDRYGRGELEDKSRLLATLMATNKSMRQAGKEGVSSDYLARDRPGSFVPDRTEYEFGNPRDLYGRGGINMRTRYRRIPREE